MIYGFYESGAPLDQKNARRQNVYNLLRESLQFDLFRGNLKGGVLPEGSELLITAAPTPLPSYRPLLLQATESFLLVMIYGNCRS